MDGPPFSVSAEEVAQHYQNHYRISRLSSESVPGGIRGNDIATLQEAWLLQWP